MSAASPTRPSRRAAASRRQVVDSSDEDEEAAQHAPENADDDEDDEEEFTPAPSRTARNQSRRKTGDVPTTPRKRRVTKSRESVEPSVLLSPAQSTATMTTAAEEESVLSSSPTKKTSPQKRRRSVRSGGRQSRASLAAPELESPPPVPPMPVLLPTPKPSTSPEPSLQPNPAGTPLADITQAVVNEVAPADEAQDNVTKLPIRFAAPEKPLMKPMDIVVRKRPSMMPMVQEQSGPKTRIVITYLVLTNFKSYAGRQEVGPFHASFSSVVGPNGSGKSNVIDSLLFVFGFRASKMRQGKISALIHNSAGHPNLDHCEVEVHFQEVLDLPAGGHEVVPDSTLVISRKAFKNNSSKYYINARESNFTTVTTLLRDRGVDLDHKRFLILQGEVESIAQMKPKAASEHDDGLLEYLEDIIGTSKYKTPIEEAAAETEALNEVCMEKSNRVQHVEREKNGLEDKKNKALAFIRDENELVRKQAALYQICTQECSDSIQVTGEAVERTQKDLDEELRNHEGSEEVIKQLQKKYKANAKEFESIEKQTQSVLKELAKMDRETVKFEEKKKFLVGKQKKLEKSLQASKFASSEAETSIKQCTADVERNVAQISELEKTMHVEEKELAAIRDSLKGKTQGLSDQIASKQKELEPWQEKINEKQAAIAVAQSELDILREKDNAGAVAVTEVKAKIEGLEEAKKSKTSELTECKVQKKEVEKDVQRVTKEMEELAKQEPGIRSKLSGARQKADEARSSLSATQTQGNVLTGLMRLKESGRIDGFHGRLGNLGAIDSQYDVAISTACPSLDNLVVDSVEVGQQCIDYLRKNNLGRANFILLDRLAQRDLSAIETPENVPRLFDLVKSKHEKFGPAFYSVLQNTLVARDLEQANRIAYGAKRWRVVTLDGQLIDKSGTMSGGGTRVARGGMSSKIAADVTKEQVAKLEVDRDELEKALEQIQQQLRELESSLKKLQEETPRLDTKAQKIALELESYDRNIADCQRRIQELSTEQQPSKSDKGRKATLEKTISTLEKELSRLNAETVGIEEEIKAHQDKIMEIGGVKLRGQKAKVDGLKEQIDTLNNEMSTAEVAMAKAEKQKIKHEKAQVDAAGELEGISADLERVATEMTSQTKDASGSKRQAEEAQEALETKKEELQALKAELDSKTAELNETRGVEIEMRNKLEESQKVLQDNQKRLRHWQDKLEKLSLQNISDIGDEAEPEVLPTYSRDELLDMSKDSLKTSIAALEASTSTSQVDLSVLADYRRRVAEHASRSADLATAISSRDSAAARRDDLRRLRLEGFMTGFAAISARLKEMYQLITLGGNAELELVDSLDPFAEGILFSVMPPKKSWKNIANLSGGEKTLSSLALVFALHHYKPTPLYVMDEIDAALDFRNVSIVASYIKERTKNAQFIVISLRNNMFELASRLVGVYKVNHMTKSVTVENRDYMVGRA